MCHFRVLYVWCGRSRILRGVRGKIQGFRTRIFREEWDADFALRGSIWRALVWDRFHESRLRGKSASLFRARASAILAARSPIEPGNTDRRIS